MQHKIIHVDMDAFYASVEQRDNPALRHKPVIVAWDSKRSVVCAASYEARVYGIHSAMPAARARKLCPHGLFVAPDFARYRQVSRQIHSVFRQYTDLIEPLSLDEAYLDVTYSKEKSATRIAQAIRHDIFTRTGLTASAGVANNKFLAKIASDWRKPDGLTVVPPDKVRQFLGPLEVKRIPGAGRVTQARLAQLGIHTIDELRQLPADVLQGEFGRWGRRLYELARGIDNRMVEANRERIQVSAEDTLENDLPLAQLDVYIQRMAEKAWEGLQQKPHRRARTVTLKLKTSAFKIITRSLTPGTPPISAAEVAMLASALRARVDLPAHTRYRLVGVGLSGFLDDHHDAIQPDFFAMSAPQQKTS